MQAEQLLETQTPATDSPKNEFAARRLLVSREYVGNLVKHLPEKNIPMSPDQECMQPSELSLTSCGCAVEVITVPLAHNSNATAQIFRVSLEQEVPPCS